MKLDKLLIFVLLPVIYLLPNTAFLNAQIPLRINQEDFALVADQLICEYPDQVNLGTQEIIDFLELVVNQSTPGATYYAPPIPELLTSAGDMISFQWDPIPMANGYYVGSLGLLDGSNTDHILTEAAVAITGLDPQLYLYAFRTEGADIIYKDLVIIIDDKDLGKGGVTGIPCFCTKKETPIIPSKPGACAIRTISSLSFPWSNKECPINKYTYDVTGKIAGQAFYYTYAFLYEQASSPFQDKIYNFSDCNPPIPVFPVLGPNQAFNTHYIEIGASTDGIHFDFHGTNIHDFKVKAYDCGCHTKVPKEGGKGVKKMESNDWNSVTNAALQISPNPFTETFTASINLNMSQTVVLQVFDLNGKLMKEESRNMEKGKHQIQLTTDGFGKGLYQVRLKTAEQIYAQKILKL